MNSTGTWDFLLRPSRTKAQRVCVLGNEGAQVFKGFSFHGERVSDKRLARSNEVVVAIRVGQDRPGSFARAQQSNGHDKGRHDQKKSQEDFDPFGGHNAKVPRR